MPQDNNSEVSTMADTHVYDAPQTLQEAERLREIAPIVRVRMTNGAESWMVLTHDLARDVLSDQRLGRAPLVTGGEIPYRVKYPEYLKSTLLFKDDPEHARLRKSVARWFTARRIEQFRERTLATANRLLDEIALSGGSAELMEAYASKLPIDVLLALLGADTSRADDFLRWTQTLLGTGDISQEELDRALHECRTYLQAEITHKRATPEGDLLSALASLTADDGLSDDEIISIAMIILIGGFDNTANMIGSGIYALLHHPEQLRQYLEDVPGQTTALAEEMLRHGRQSMGRGLAIPGIPSVALEDLTIGGVDVRAGEHVMVNRNAASHDAAVFSHPDELDIQRSPNPHLGLSHGIHHCLGAPLARMELQVAYSALFSRFPATEITGEVTYQTDMISQPILTLPVVLHS